MSAAASQTRLNSPAARPSAVHCCEAPGQADARCCRTDPEPPPSARLEALGHLASGIAHEINTPVQYVGDNLEFLQGGFTDIVCLIEAYGRLARAVAAHPAAAEFLADIERLDARIDTGYLCQEIPRAVEQSLEGVERVAEIVRAMKAFSHPGTAEPTAVDINAVVRNTLTLARNEWKYVADVVLDLDESLPPVPCRGGDLQQALLNLVINAAHAIGDVVGDASAGRGELRVGTRRQGDWVEIRIHDTGPGIADAIQPRVFDEYFTTKQVGRGTGQGLAIAHAIIVDRHAGTLHFESEAGRGTTFFVRLPLHEARLEQAGDRIDHVMLIGAAAGV